VADNSNPNEEAGLRAGDDPYCIMCGHDMPGQRRMQSIVDLKEIVNTLDSPGWKHLLDVWRLQYFLTAQRLHEEKNPSKLAVLQAGVNAVHTRLMEESKMRVTFHAVAELAMEAGESHIPMQLILEKLEQSGGE